VAKPPDIQAIARDTIPEAPGWLEKLLRPLNSHLGATTRALGRGLTFSENFNAVVKSFTVKMPDDWRALTLQGGWARHPDLGFLLPAQRKATDGSGEVTTRGLIERPAGVPAAPSDVAICPFPAQSRGRVTCNGATLDIRTTGATIGFDAGAAIAFLDTVRYVAADRRPALPGDPFPLSLACVGDKGEKLSGRPAHVVITGCVDLDSGLSAPCPLPDWAPATFTGAPGVTLRNLVGLTPLRSYRLTALITV
jgi:hypothetical protein